MLLGFAVEFVLQVSATLSILLTWIDGCALDEPVPLLALEPMEPDALEPDALEPMLLEPLADGLLALLLSLLLSLLPLAPFAFVTVPVTATS